MFIKIEIDYDFWSYIDDGTASKSFKKKYKNKNPHIIYDSDFEVCILNITNYNDLISEFIWLYKFKNEDDVLRYIIYLLKWINDKDNNHFHIFYEILKNEHPQYTKDIEKYLTLI